MPQYLNLPSGNSILVQDGVDPQQAWIDALRDYPEEFGYKPKSKAESGFFPALSAGLSRLGGEAALTAGKAGILDLAKAEEIYRRQQKKAEGIFKPTEEGWTEAPLQKLKEIAGGSAAYMLAPAAAGAAALAAPVVAPGLAGAVGLGALGAGLAGLAGVGQYTGSNLAAQMEEGKKGLAETSGLAAVGAAVPQAALDVLSLRMLPGVQRIFKSVGKEVTEEQAKALAAQSLRQKIGDYAAATGKSMGVEGATEVAQDMLEKLQAGASLTDPKAREDYLENLIGGAALAGVLGPFGRGFERAGIQAKGRELEAARLDQERKDALAARQQAAGQEATQQFGTLFPEVGPVSPMYGTPANLAPEDLSKQSQLLQNRLTQIDQEAEQARKAKDMDALARLQNERLTLEQQAQAQAKADPSLRAAQIQAELARAVKAKDVDAIERLQNEQQALQLEQRLKLQQQIAYYENIEAKLIEQARAALTVAEKQPILAKLVEVKRQKEALQKTFAQQEETKAIPSEQQYETLLAREKRLLNGLRKAEESGNVDLQFKLASQLQELQQQLGLFGQDAYLLKTRFETKQAEDAAAAEANKPKLLLTDQRRAEPIPMGYNFEAFPTPPRTPQDYLQETLFGPAERVAVPATTEMTLPDLQRAVSSLSERSDLSEADRGLLDRVSDLVLPKQQISTVPGLQKELDAIAERQRSVEQTIEQKRAAPIRLQQKIAELQSQIAALKTKGAQLEEQIRQTPATQLRAQRALTAAQEAGPPTLEAASAAEQARALANLPTQAAENAAQLKQAEEQLRVLTRKEAAVRQRTDRGIAKLERLQEKLRKERSMRSAQQAALPSTAAPLEQRNTTGAVSAQARVDAINREIEALARNTQEDKFLSNKQRLDRIEQLRQEQASLIPEAVALRQRIADWVSDTSRGLDTTNSRKALEEALLRLETAPRGEKEARTKLKRRIATPEERAALGKKSVLERVPTAVTTTAQQPDLFAGTEAERATEFETPKEMQEFMASAELQKRREAEAQRELATAQEAGPPTPADVQRFKKRLQPTTAFLNKQANKIRGFLKGLTRKLDDYKALLSAKVEQDDEALAKAKRQQAEVLLAIEKTLLKEHQQYARAVLELQQAKETYDGLEDFVNNYVNALDTAVKMSAEWSGLTGVAQERFQKGLEARKKTLWDSLTRLNLLRQEVSDATSQLDDARAMEALAAESGKDIGVDLAELTTAINAKKAEMAAATQAAQKAVSDFYGFAGERENRTKVDIPAHWQVSNRDLRKFLVQQAELTDMLIEQNLVVEKWQSAIKEFEDTLTAARAAAKADPVWSAFLEEAQDAVNAASVLKLRAPDKLMAAIRAANAQINNLKKEARAASTAQEAQARLGKNLAAVRERAAKQAKTSADIRAENERLEREGEAKTRVTFEKQSKQDREAIAGLQQRLDKLVSDKKDAIDKKRGQTTHFRFTADEKKAIADGTKTREQVIDAKRDEGVKQLAAQFDAAIEKVQAEIRAIRGVAKPSEKREARIKSAVEVQRRIGEEGPLETAEEVANIAKTQRQGRTAQTLVDVRTGRVSEGRSPNVAQAMTEAQERREAIEANNASYHNSLVKYAKVAFDEDLSALDTDALEYKILELQAKAEDEAALRRPATEKENITLAKTMAAGEAPLGRVISHDYASRENTPLDDATAAAVNKGDLVAALTSLAKNGSTPYVRMVAQRLLPMVENTKLETAALEGKGGEYDAQTDTVTLNKDALTEEDLLHEAGHAATNAVASYEAEGGMTRRQFLKGAVTGLTALKLPNITENMSLAAQEEMFFDMLQAWDGWVKAASKIAPALKLSSYTNLDVADRDLRGFLELLEYHEVSDDAVVEMLKNGGLKKLQASINASQRAIMAEAAKTSEGKTEAQKETFKPTKDQLAARTALEQLYAKMQGRPEFKDEYGNVSFKEFVSELLSNQQVRDKINQTAGLLRRIYEGFLRMLGIEPKTLSDKALEQAFAMFSPSTARVGREERLASIMRGVFPDTQSKFSSAVPKSISDTVNRTIARSATVGDKVMANLTGLRLRTFIADQWAPVEALMKMGVAKGVVKAAQALQMQVYMRLFSNMQEYTNSALINGVPELKKDEAGIRTIEGGDANVNAVAMAKALDKASALGNQQAVERTFTMWMASLRAKQEGIGFEKMNFGLSPKEMAELKQSLVDLEGFFKTTPAVKDAFEEARQLYRQHNRRLLNLQVQTGVMSKDVADELAKGDYIGFYRVNNNGVVELMMGGSRPVRVGNIIDQPYLKELVGGKQHILPFFASMAQNTSLMMHMALKNMQHTNTAYMFQDLGLGKIHSVPEGKEPPQGKLRFKQNGQDYWFAEDADAFDKMDVPFDLVMQGLQGVKTAVPALVKAMAIPANILRKTVRRIPIYTLRQTIRDPSHAWLTTGGNFVPILSTWKEMYRGFTKQSKTQLSLKEAAVIGNNVYSGDAEGVAEMLRTLSSDPSKFSQVMMKLDELAMQGEAATRAVLYDDFRKRGMSHVEALLNTVETMNFSRRGTSASLHWLSQMTPFFNAQIQGLDAAYRALRGKTTFEEKLNARNALLKRGALMAASTMAYALMMEDDETYKNSTPEERYGNWFVRVPGTETTVKVPIPFELGLIFKSLPEALINVAYGDKKASEAAKALAKQVYMSSPFGVPTAVKGPLEVMFNYNMYSDQPIETAHERTLDTDQRYRSSTTELAKLLGKTGLISPVQIDHLIRSYTGSLGILTASMANFALRPISGRTDVEPPDMSLTDVPVIGTAFQPTTGRGMVNAVFDDIAKYQRASMTYKELAKSDPEAAREYANKFSREIALAATGGSFRQQMGEFAQYKRMVASNPGLTGAQKREQIEAIKRQEIEFAKQLRKLAA